MPPDLPFEQVLELVGVFVGGLSGALAAIRKQFDIFGIVVLGWAAGLGGGLMRDVLIGALPPVGIGRWEFIATACLAGVTMYFFHPRLERARRMIAVFDAGALALFTVVGTVKGLSMDAGPTASVCVGVITGVGGGVLRDLLTGEVPVVLHHRQLYAIPAVVGASATVALWSTSSLSTLTVGLVVGLVLGLRLVAMRFHLNAPGPWRGGVRGG
ncbi:MAG: trimeric intracellular cation channel family protein [Cellulomonas sp.]